MEPTSTDPLIGTEVGGRYRVERRLGKGGMGAIYEVVNTRLDRSYAMKVLFAQLGNDEGALARFRREAEVVARFRHPNIVDIVDWETLPDGSPCMIMELLRGEDLATRIRRLGPLDWTTIRETLLPLLSALTVAHKAGVVHRDLKPANIFLARDDAGIDHPKLLDFGISKVHDAATKLTATDQVMGTPAYMAPEQVAGERERIGAATDAWAVGTILYEMIVGRPAFEGPTIPSVLNRVCFGTPAPIVEARPDVPAEIVTLIDQMLQREPTARPDIPKASSRLGRALEAVDVGSAATAPAHSLEPAGGRRASDAFESTELAAARTQGGAVSTRADRSRRARWIGLAVGSGGVVAIATAMISGGGSVSTDPIQSGRTIAPSGASSATTAPAAPIALSGAREAATTQKLMLKVTSKPKGARLKMRGAKLAPGERWGLTPWSGSIVRPDSGVLELDFELNGHGKQSIEVRVSPDAGSARAHAELQRTSPPKPASFDDLYK